MNILVTGAKGFVGKNLVENLKNIRDGKDKTKNFIVNEIYEYDIDSTIEELDIFCSKADFVFNLAGVNRPKDNSEFMAGNFGFASTLLETLKKYNPDMTIWAVEPENAAILSGGSIGTHVQMGIGDGVIPEILNQDIYDDVCIIKDEEAIRISKELASKEGIMCGISSGTNVAAALKLAKKLGKGKTVVTVLPDTAERYFSTPLFE